MISKAGLAWDNELLLNRLLEDCGVQCELVTPQMLATPYFRGKFVSLVVPTGFANPKFSNLLPALRASAQRIRRFVEMGGNLLVFGAMDTSPGVYNWLPFSLEYAHEYFSTRILFDTADAHCSILDDFDKGEIECDGYFPVYEGKPVATTEDGRVLMVCYPLGKGTILATTFHEYPSRMFLKMFCTADRETLF